MTFSYMIWLYDQISFATNLTFLFIYICPSGLCVTSDLRVPSVGVRVQVLQISPRWLVTSRCISSIIVYVFTLPLIIKFEFNLRRLTWSYYYCEGLEITVMFFITIHLILIVFMVEAQFKGINSYPFLNGDHYFL